MSKRKTLPLLILAATVFVSSCSISQKSSNTAQPAYLTSVAFHDNLSSFKDFSEKTVKAEIKVVKMTENSQNIKSAAVSYDLNGDGSLDNIKIVNGNTANSHGESTVTVNSIKANAYFDNPYAVCITDLDRRDKLKEIAIMDNGPSDDPNIHFFRYNGKEIINMGSVHQSIRLDGYGKVVSTWNMTSFEPEIVFGYYEIAENKLSFVKLDYASCMNKQYTVKENMMAYLKEYDTVPKNFTPSFTEADKSFMLKKGEKLTINAVAIVDNVAYWYTVKFQNGKRGALYFWNGD